jgi:anti-anti-sigma factor
VITRELEVQVRDGQGVPVLELTGDVNSSAEAALAEAYAEAAASGPAAVVLDFAQTGYINSTGIALIVGLLGQARAQGIEIRAVGLSDHYRELFEITRLSDFMTIEGSSDA